ncbi:putative 2,3,4,5-tetrahydropyridine-2,6-dicarboxylate N-succinyltransferase [Mycobacterium kansasii]|uniref:Putative 2,3,4,5-tetrahydropyridine-2,6-dicarboxylate N-succinyltransferase n=1 Tax=Mycobacterium kansasii TaxID=1768 RepID=A0A1V3XLI7_MYCKA|nr:putative 2,3,4,5-tetrahydropyridine-2,6-dicarboxylate N-succinyltransferase [Mycobacterium kansasii]
MTGAAGIGLATLAADGSVLDTWFPAPELTESDSSGTSRLALSDIPPSWSRWSAATTIAAPKSSRSAPSSARWTMSPPTRTTPTFGCICCRTDWWRRTG